MKNLFILVTFLLFGCVPYQQQLQSAELNKIHGYLAEAKKGMIIESKQLYQNQLEYENYLMGVRQEITLLTVLPKYELAEKYKIIISEGQLLIPVAGDMNAIAYTDYFIVWDGKLQIDTSNHASVDLIFMQRIPDKLPMPARDKTLTASSRIYRIPAYTSPFAIKPKYPDVKYVSFDLSPLKDHYKNSVTLRLLGLDFPMEYSYP